jgi:flagellar assembly protein FliH
MGAPMAKFTFDLDLGNAPQRPKATVSEDSVALMLASAREQAYAEGLAAGERSATAMAAQSLALAAQHLAAQAIEAGASIDSAQDKVLGEAVELAASVGRKLAAQLLAREPAAELEALLKDCMGSLEGVPHLVIRCHPELADAIREIALGEIEQSGFAGRLVVMGDPELRLGDGRIEWVDGGLVRDMATISDEIDKRIAAYCAARLNKKETQA